MKTLVEGAGKRLGTVAAAYLVGVLGIPEDLALKAVMAGGVLLGLAVDIAVASLLARAR